jgi:hypothetical protein
MKDTTYPSTGARNTGSSDTRQVMSYITVINPYIIRFCRWPGITVEGAQSCSSMARGGRGNNTSKILVFPLFSFSLSLSPLFIPLSFSGVGKEVRRSWKIVQKDLGVCKSDHQL